MYSDYLKILDTVFNAITILGIGIAIYQLYDVRRTRLIEMYWKIAEIYATTEQKEARKNIHAINKTLVEQEQLLVSEEDLLAFYNDNYHNSPIDTENKKIDKSIQNRIRLLNQIGVLLKRRLIDKDLLFALVGLGLELDCWVIQLILKAYRKDHNGHNIYVHFEDTLIEYGNYPANGSVI